MGEKLFKQYYEHFLAKDKGFFDKLYEDEKCFYKKLLSITKHPILGTVEHFCKEFNIDSVEFIGILDGLNDSLIIPNNIEEIEIDTIITLDYDKEKLYKNMLANKCDMSVWGIEKPYYENKPDPDLTPQKIAQANAAAQDWLNKPKCPTCGSLNVKRISAISKVAGASMFGLFSKTAKSQFCCRNCGYKW
ncbi:hypothetical protein RJD28_11525 [Oscillospiraceae bacterium NTUH-002-81]|nr:hypothetical protein RJD28_11525 [Oscillospiraceae bacterium NTUH-002-81]